MPGNETRNTQPREWLPVMWAANNIPAGVTTPQELGLAGATGIKRFPLPDRASIVTVAIMLSEPVTAGFIRLEAMLDGALTGKQIDIDSADGKYKVFRFAPGKFVFDALTRISFAGGSHPALAPSGVIDLAILVEVQPEG